MAAPVEETVVVAARTGVAAALLAEHADALAGVCSVHVRVSCDPVVPGVSLQLWDACWKRSLALMARAGVALGLSGVRLEPMSGYVRVRAVGEVSTTAGVALVELWDHLTGDAIDQAAALLGVGLSVGEEPVEVPAELLAGPFGVRV
ncbi:hypothetical protein ACFV4N_32495 [Actinosynnema sp. NPDC059797]